MVTEIERIVTCPSSTSLLFSLAYNVYCVVYYLVYDFTLSLPIIRYIILYLLPCFLQTETFRLTLMKIWHKHLCMLYSVEIKIYKYSQ